MQNQRILFLLLPVWSCVQGVVLGGFLMPTRRTMCQSNNPSTPDQGRPSALSTLRLNAKKKKKKKKPNGNKQQKSGFSWAASFTLQPHEAQSTRELVTTAVSSFQGRTGKPLCDDVVGAMDIPKALWNSPSVACVVVTPPDGSVAYANVAALETLGLTEQQWERVMMNPSRRPSDVDDTVEDDDYSPRIKLDLPVDMKDRAYESGYQKKIWRKSQADDDDEGRLHDITIVDAHRWKLEKSALTDDGSFVTASWGIAYAWNEWVLDDGTTVCAPGGRRRQVVNADDAQRAVDRQAGKIREMKEGRGLTNKDPQVQEAVAELLRLKSVLAEGS